MAVNIDRCNPNDIEDVVRFIDDHWKRGHALVTSRTLLDWQHRNPDGGYSFVVARAGRQPSSASSATSRRCGSIRRSLRTTSSWLTTWKVRDDAGVAGVGLALLQYLTTHEPHAGIGAIGLNPATRPIYQALGYRHRRVAALRPPERGRAPLRARDADGATGGCAAPAPRRSRGGCSRIRTTSSGLPGSRYRRTVAFRARPRATSPPATPRILSIRIASSR